jgi:uncharacterized protein (TIGR02271 family)
VGTLLPGGHVTEPAHASWVDQPLLDGDGDVFGTVHEVFVDVESDEPVWLEVLSASTARAVLVPAAGATMTTEGLQVLHDAQTLVAAPGLSSPDGPTPEDDRRVRQHYARSRAGGASDQDGAEVVRHEEELHVSTEVRQAGTVRLRKWVETETVSDEVVVHQEFVRVEREPVTLSNVDEAMAHAVIEAAEYEVVLNDEHVVASKVIVPREVVRVAKETVIETVLVEADLRREEVAVETTGDVDDSFVSRP